MFTLYCVVNDIKPEKYYIGMTASALEKRLYQHKRSAMSGKNTPLYALMRKYGCEHFRIVPVAEFPTREQCAEAEIDSIATAYILGHDILNLAKGGEGGFVIQDTAAWKKKLSASRNGRKPALGMKHTEENKKLFREASRKYWDSVGTYDASTVCSLPFMEAHKQYGISKTHYYRLKKRLLSSDQ